MRDNDAEPTLRQDIINIRLTEAEKERARRVAKRLGCSIAAAYRMGMNRLYEEMFKDRDQQPNR